MINQFTWSAIGRLTMAGNIDTVEPDGDSQHHQRAILIEFDTADQMRKAIQDGICKFAL